MDEYRLLKNERTGDLAKEVSRFLSKGWTLQGGPIASGQDIIQAIARNETARAELADRIGDVARLAMKEKNLLPLAHSMGVEGVKSRMLKAKPDVLDGFEHEEVTFIVRRLAERMVGSHALN